MENQVELPAQDSLIQGAVINTIPLTPKNLKIAADYVIQSKVKFEGERADIESQNRMVDRAWRVKLEAPASDNQDTSNQATSSVEGRAYTGYDDKASPIVNDNVEAIKARLSESIMIKNNDYVGLDGVESNDILKLRELQLNKQLDRQNIEQKIETIVHNTVVFGTCYLYVPYLNEDKSVLTRQLVQEKRIVTDVNGQPQVDPNTGQPLFQIVESIQIVPEQNVQYKGPGYTPVQDNDDIYLDRYIEDIQKQPIVIQRFIVDWNYLSDGVEKGVFIADQVLKIRDKIYTGQDNSRSQDVHRVAQFNDSGNGEGLPKQYEMFQAYCELSLPEVLEDGQKIDRVYNAVVCVIGNEVIRLESNPYFHQQKPLIKIVYRKIPGESYGQGAIDPILDIYHEYNDTMNQINDAKILSLNPVIIESGRTASDNKDLDVYPGARWKEKVAGEIRAFSMDFAPVANGLQYLELLEQKINRGMGVTRLLQGSGDETDLDKTARGVIKVIDQADKKFRKIAKGIEYSAIKLWAEMALKVNIQYSNVPTGFSFEDINQESAIIVRGVDNFYDNEEEIQKLIAFTQQSAQLPGVNLPGLVLTIADKMKIKIDESKYGPLYQPPQPTPPEEKPIGVNVSIPIDPSKGTYMAGLASQVLAMKGLQPDVDSIGEAGAIMTEFTPENIKEESGILPKEMSRSVHTVKKTTEGTRSVTETAS